MKDLQSLSHIVWDCKFHAVWVPEYRRRFYGGKSEESLGQFSVGSVPRFLTNLRSCTWVFNYIDVGNFRHSIMVNHFTENLAIKSIYYQ